MISMRHIRISKISADRVKRIVDCTVSKSTFIIPQTQIRIIFQKQLKNEHSSQRRTYSREPSLLLENPFSRKENEEFMAYFPEFVDVLTSEEMCSRDLKFKKQLAELLKYNVDLGTNARGLATVIAYEALRDCETISPENLKLANILGWCVRMTESSFSTLDDIVDNSSTRGGKTCWFRRNDVGLRAIFHAAYMGNGVYYILKKFFSAHPQYHDLVDLFLESNFRTYIGQSLDVMCREWKDFTVVNYHILAESKAGYCAMYTSVAAAMFLANISDEELHRRVRSLLTSLAIYCQIQNDFLDCYGSLEKTGKIGTDIKEGKLSWLAVKTLEKARRSQKILMQEHYGKDDDESFQIIRNLYDEMNLVEEYKLFEEQMYSTINSKISQLPKTLPHELFYSLLNKVLDEKWLF